MLFCPPPVLKVLAFSKNIIFVQQVEKKKYKQEKKREREKILKTYNEGLALHLSFHCLSLFNC